MTSQAASELLSSERVNHAPKAGSDVWSQVQALLIDHSGEATFRRWFGDAQVSVTSGASPALTVTFATRFMRDWVDSHYGDILRLLWRKVAHNDDVSLCVASEQSSNKKATNSAKSADDGDEAGEEAISVVANEGVDGGKETQQKANGASLDITAPVESILDARFTFENFVVGKPNELAYAAAQRVADVETPTFNPLFLYGGPGLGKTHLMHAIAWKLRETFPNRRVLYLSAERFMYQFVRALRYKDTVSFKEHFRSVDVLMIDDVQFISGKDTTQEEFFHTFNALVDRNRQVIVSADKSPQDLDRIEERLRSRLGWGLVADLHPATYELRLGILHAKAEALGCPMPDKVLEFLAQRITTNVRELEGALNRVIAHSQLVGRTITLDMTHEVLADLLRSTDRRISIDEIQKKVAEHWNVRMADLLSDRRARTVARPRQVAMFLSKQLTSRSLPEIGRKFGGRDHTTVLHAVRKVEEIMKADTSFAEDVMLVRRLLQG